MLGMWRHTIVILVGFFSCVCSDAQTAKDARRAIQGHYASMDTAVKAGRLERALQFATADATFQARSGIRSLREAIAEDHEAARGTSRVRKTTITGHSGDMAPFELKGKTALVRVRAVTETTEGAITRISESYSLDSWEEMDGSWRLRSSQELLRAELPAKTSPETSDAVVSAIKAVALPLAGVEAGNPYSDMAAFGKAVGDARVVALGEASHGSREIFQMKHRLLEYLVKEKGFTVFAIEAGWPASEAADVYVKTGEGDPKTALSAMNMWPWQTEEVLAMLVWMRGYNQTRGNRRPLSFVGVDIQGVAPTQARVLATVRRSDPEILQSVEAAYQQFESQLKKGVRGAAFAETARAVADVVALLESRPAIFRKTMAAEGYRDLLQMARIVAMNAKRYVSSNASYRDEMMANLALWHLNETHPEEKMVLWAHNSHVARREGSYRPIGDWLTEKLHQDVFALGFAIGEGTATMFTWQDGKRLGLKPVALKKAEPGTGTATLQQVGMPLFFLDLRGRSGVLAEWLDGQHLFRETGAGTGMEFAASAYGNMRAYSLRKRFDGLIYLDQTNGSRILDSCEYRTDGVRHLCSE